MEYFKYNLFGINCLMTIGAKDLADTYGAYWLVNAILSYQIYKDMKNESFQVWRLKRVKDDEFVLICDDGNGNILQKQEIEFSYFPENNAVLWFIDGVLLLPSEY